MKVQGMAVEERLELERELKTHPGNIVQSEDAKAFTEAELAELDTLHWVKRTCRAISNRSPAC